MLCWLILRCRRCCRWRRLLGRICWRRGILLGWRLRHRRRREGRRSRWRWIGLLGRGIWCRLLTLSRSWDRMGGILCKLGGGALGTREGGGERGKRTTLFGGFSFRKLLEVPCAGSLVGV